MIKFSVKDMGNYFEGFDLLRAIVAAIVVLVLLGSLAGCERSYQNLAGKYVLPEDLKDCTFTGLTSTTGYITVVRCPMSTTTTKGGGKHPPTVVTIDGVEYEMYKKEKKEKTE